ncbi:ABC-type sugar transport system, ATPase component [Lactobacillus selangorensis]|uniref:ABC-type sugar transport system, ATPase component n=1 Tax=Lactobacillus selangorensis TaxID=81857 RepID=A0A0R2G5L6_9LACO|nr:ABC transporter ATP-binding protein [Lactobacillus selangorensis]KRN28879.1 ABC-type sugar transport system, ATPase component [Lactobacillus selangorensis]KRN32711.1 ABC-type sugar transport system, ATPase component [Lactobacillus selangorensis]
MDVTFKNVTFAYDNKAILHHIDFNIPEGKLISILGPSGCGKSTTLNLISGLIQPDAGQILFGDKPVTNLDALQRKVGMVFQSYALYPHMTVLENIIFPMKMAKVPKTERVAKAKELAQLVHIENEVDKHPAELSGGQQQRVAIARALAKEPAILLLDEPLSNLDARLRVQMREEIRRIQKKTGVTTVFVTHDQDEAMHISDQIMVLNDGRIQQFSTPNQLYDQPQNLFVARFIGSPVINTLPFAPFKDAFAELVAPEILAQATHIGIRSESIVSAPHQEAVLVKLPGRITRHDQYGRELLTEIQYKDQQLASTNFKQTADGDFQAFYLLKKGVFLFNAAGHKLMGGEADA